MRKLYIPVLIILSLLSVSCGKKYIGYGVLLWSPNENILETGSVYPVVSESKINDTYTIKAGESGDLTDIPKWRISFFENEEDAKAEAADIVKYKTIFARNLKDGLLIRQEPDVNSSRVYKMKRGQVIKVIGRQEKTSQVGQYSGFWYRVLTEDGVQGYCFDHYLDVYDSSIPPEKQIDPAQKLLDEAFSKSYHPGSFVTMIKNSTIILDYFKPQIGLFPDTENKILTLTTGSYTLKYTWDKPVLIDKRSFELGDTGFEVSVISDNHIRVAYTYEGTKVRSDYYVIDNMDEIIAAEMDRREALYEKLMNEGKPYVSSAYGTIKFFGNREFSWNNYSRLVPQIIPEGTGNSGKLYFDVFISPDLKTDNDGVLTFGFDSGGKTNYVYFLYRLDGGKLRLTYVPSSYISEHIVVRKTSSPLILAFSSR